MSRVGPPVGHEPQLERVDSIGVMLDAFRGWPDHNSAQAQPCLEKNDREKRRRIIAQAHSKLCGDVPSLGGSKPTDYLEMLLLGGVQKIVHVSDLKGNPAYHIEMIATGVTRAVNGGHHPPSGGGMAEESRQLTVLRQQLLATGGDPKSPTAVGAAPGPGATHNITRIFNDTWALGFEQLSEKKVPREETLAIQGVAFAACDVILRELAKNHEAATQTTLSVAGGGLQKRKSSSSSSSGSNVFSAMLHWSTAELNDRTERLEVAMRTSGAPQRYEKRALTTGKDEFEARLEGLAFYRTHLIALLTTFHQLTTPLHHASSHEQSHGGGSQAAVISRVSLVSVGAVVAESGYKSRDFALSRTALAALGTCHDLVALLSIKGKLPIHFDPQGARQPDTKSSLKAAWQSGRTGSVQLWEPGTAIALGSVCVRAMFLAHLEEERKRDKNNTNERRASRSSSTATGGTPTVIMEDGESFPFEFIQCFSILLRHPQPQVFLAVLSHYVEMLTSTSLRMCLCPDPVVYAGLGGELGEEGTMTVLDFAFDRLLGRCAAVGSSKVEILATLGMVERFADRVFSQNHQEVFGRIEGGGGSNGSSRTLVSTSWFANLPVTLGGLWDRFPDNAGIVLAAVRVWAALLLLDRCVGSNRQRLEVQEELGSDLGSTLLRHPTEADLQAEEAANVFFQFLLYNPVFRTLHLQTGGLVIFDALDHFVTLLTHVGANNNLPDPEVDSLLHMVIAVLLEAPFIGDTDGGSSTRRWASRAGRGGSATDDFVVGGDATGRGSGVTAKLTATLKKLLLDPALAEYKCVVEEACTELASCADARGSQQLAVAIRLCST